MINQMAPPVTEPANTKMTFQANLRIDNSVPGPMNKPAKSIARYTPMAMPLTGMTPAITDQRLLSICSHGLPPLQPAMTTPVRKCQLRMVLKTNAKIFNPVKLIRHQGQVDLKSFFSDNKIKSLFFLKLPAALPFVNATGSYQVTFPLSMFHHKLIRFARSWNIAGNGCSVFM